MKKGILIFLLLVLTGYCSEEGYIVDKDEDRILIGSPNSTNYSSSDSTRKVCQDEKTVAVYKEPLYIFCEFQVRTGYS